MASIAHATDAAQPWCVINHADPVFDLDCHISEIDWVNNLGLSLGTSDGAPVAVEVHWDFGGAESLGWTPGQARDAAAVLLRLAEVAERSNASDAGKLVTA